METLKKHSPNQNVTNQNVTHQNMTQENVRKQAPMKNVTLTRLQKPTAPGDDNWRARALCSGTTDDLFVESKAQKRVRVMCRDCPVAKACLAEALDNKIEWGIWGGMTERERRQLLRERPDIRSWRDVLLGGEGEIPARRKAS